MTTSLSGPRGRLEAFFAFQERGTSWRTEIVAGVTTFVTMAYILFVNPAILTAVVCGLLFALCLGLAPLAGVVPPHATGAVLVLVGFFMMKDVGSIPWDDATEAIPAFLTLTVMPFTYSITNGIGAGFVSYVGLKLLRGRWRDVHPLLAASALAFLAYFVAGRG